MHRRWLGALSGCLGLWALAAAPAAAASALFAPLTVVLASGDTGDLGFVTVAEEAGMLVFSIDVSAIGPGADVKRLFFNLPPTFDGVMQMSAYAPVAFEPPGQITRADDIFFDRGIRFGDGPNALHDALLPQVTVMVGANQRITLADIARISRTRGGIDVQIGVELMGLGAGNTIVGGMLIPEPGTLLLLGSGLAGLGIAGRRRRR